MDLLRRGLVRPPWHVGARCEHQGRCRRRRRTHADRGSQLPARAANQAGRTSEGRLVLDEASSATADASRPTSSVPRRALARPVHDAMTAQLLREMVSPTDDFPLLVERERALYGAWYEIFPARRAVTTTRRRRSGCPGPGERGQTTARDRRHGFRRRSPHPDPPDRRAARKGPNNTPDRRPHDPGSPYAIGRPTAAATRSTRTWAPRRLRRLRRRSGNATDLRSPGTSPSRPPRITAGQTHPEFFSRHGPTAP